MSGQELLEGLSHIDEKYIDEAEHAVLRKCVPASWRRWISAAACLCILIAGVYGVQNAFQYGETEGIANEEAAAGEPVPEGAEEAAPEDGAVSENASVILRVDEWNEDGFTGTVMQLVDADVFEIGMVLNAVYDEAVAQSFADGAAPVQESAEELLVCVQFRSYDEESGTIVVCEIRAAVND